MSKTILITGATDGIGLETAKMLAADGHHLLLHGRNEAKAKSVKQALLSSFPQVKVEIYIADLSNLNAVKVMAEEILASRVELDVLINNAGVFVTKTGLSSYGLDTRFIVNTIAPYLLTRLLLPALQTNARVINLSSKAQMPINWDAFINGGELDASSAYAQSKLGITLWSMALAEELGPKAMVLAVNPKSFLGSKMVEEAYGQKGYDLRIGAKLLYQMALSEKFAHASGKYYDNDVEDFGSPHPDALRDKNRAQLIQAMNMFLAKEKLLELGL